MITPAGIVIRPVMAADHEAVIDLLWELNRFEDALSEDRAIGRADAEACFRADQNAAIQEPGGALLVAESAGTIVGFLALAIETGRPFLRADLRRHGHVLDLVIAGSTRGKGIGQALLAEAERLTIQAGCKALLIGVVESNTRAIAAYRKFGFEPSAREFMKRLDQD